MPVLCELHVDLPGFMCETSGSLNILLRFGSGRVMQDRTGECRKRVGRRTRTWLQLLSCALIAHNVLIWLSQTEEEAETKVDIQTEVTGRHK